MPAKRSSALSVLVVEDQRAFAEALGLALSRERDIRATFSPGGDEALRAVQASRPDVVLLDVARARMDGVDGIRRMRLLHPGVRVIVMAEQSDDRLRSRALEAGATGYLSRETPLSEVPSILRRARSGEPLIERAEAVRLLRVLHHRRRQESTERQRANRMTPQQTAILQMLADGLSNQEIRDRLGVTPSTLRTHVQNILTKLGVHRKEEAVVVAIRHGRISPHP